MKLKMLLLVILVVLLSMYGIYQTPDTVTDAKVTLKGQWITETNGQVMLDPQTSGLKHWRGKLLSISDGSAHQSQSSQLHVIDPKSAVLDEQDMSMTMSENVTSSCFAPYLAYKPDFEALAVDPNDDNVVIIVTEDARSIEGLSAECAKRYQNSGSTDFPSLLVRLYIHDNKSVEMTHVRPLQFAAEFEVGNFPNDGIEGLAFGQDNQLYLALEKDIHTQPRIFSVQITKDFWNTDEFAKVLDPELRLPQFTAGNHPLNGMDYLAIDDHPGYLIAAARNDNQLWFIDLSKQNPTKIITLDFMAETNDNSCEPWELMDNSSLEGLGVIGSTIWVVNDPWKRNYLKNINCPSNQANYEKMAPLLFSLPVAEEWINH
ncbi:hypothetical protein RT723_03125 [Psychrosphaera aquimarina]|uniref:Phytase-like domain-containing protein n=1 Tax=Psychrosphaera aquimarina TaxID=2044854 RepID=A0ABU3QXV9_9GAMM|nr:esterase-like activity of phytase family protein [Psychrosphaera aquimarina]MDU0112010.1 hypothetical protein [Psychrosphaera aquimarina]